MVTGSHPTAPRGELRLPGEGRFLVTDAVTDLAAVLRMSEGSARRCVGQLIELREPGVGAAD